jgi:anti-sigma-K factor RskA
MSKEAPFIDSLLGDLDTPEPPSALKSMVLQATAEALNRPPAPDIWTRIWDSRPLRLAWAATVSALIAGHLAVTAVQQQPEPPAMTVSNLTEVDQELAEISDLPRLRLAVRPLSESYSGESG